MIRTGIGQDSHRIREDAAGKAFVLGGITFDVPYCLEGNSDADAVLHAVTNAISGITGRPVIGPVADALCKQGFTDSAVYLAEALKDLAALSYRLVHVSVSIECAKPKILPRLEAMRARLAELLGIEVGAIGITATTGEGLTDFGRGLGVQAFATATAAAAGLSSNG